MALTVIAIALAVLATIAVACLLLGLVLFIGRDRSSSHLSIDEMIARDDAFAQNIADRMADKIAVALTDRLKPRSDPW